MLEAINSVGLASQKFHAPKSNEIKSAQNFSQNATSVYSKAASKALKLNGLNLASTVRFTGALHGAFADLNTSMQTCKTQDKKGESVGSRANVNKLLHDFAGEFSQPNDAIKTTIEVNKKTDDKTNITTRTFARTQIKLLNQDSTKDKQELRFEMSVRHPEFETKSDKEKTPLLQNIQIDMTPINYKGEGTYEQAYILNTKGNLMAVVEDGENVLLTNAGKISKKDGKGTLNVDAVEFVFKPVSDQEGAELKQEKNEFKPFIAAPQPVTKREIKPSDAKGTEIVIGMEDGRFVDEIKASIKEFVKKINSGEIILPEFKEAPNAQDVQLIMLAGGFGSRAEYTNASSSAIFHDVTGGAQSTKGVFRTATGLTPMETTFVTLHKAGLLNCTAGSLKIGDNIKFYLNKGQNRGNGEFSADLYNTMTSMPNRKYAMIFPNDSMSRLTNAVIEANKKMQTGKAAIAMVAKEVKSIDCIKNFGIMRIDDNGKIVAFAEKPSKIDSEFKHSKNGVDYCYTNTFQFAVSDEAFRVLDKLEPFFITKKGEKESRDWSKQFVPIIKTLTQDRDNMPEIETKLSKALGRENLDELPKGLIEECIDLLRNQEIYAIKTDEPWADCGTLNQLVHTTMEIASGAFPLEDFERAHVLECVDTKTGLVASSKEQKAEILKKYDIDGQVMVVPQAKPITDETLAEIPVIEHID